jgi:hypothetical protein
MTEVSSTYRHQHAGLCVTCSGTFFSESSMKKLAITRESGETLIYLQGLPFVCIEVCYSIACWFIGRDSCCSVGNMLLPVVIYLDVYFVCCSLFLITAGQL